MREAQEMRETRLLGACHDCARSALALSEKLRAKRARCWEDGGMSIFLLETGSRRTDWPHRKARFARHASRMVALRATTTLSCVNRSSSEQVLQVKHPEDGPVTVVLDGEGCPVGPLVATRHPDNVHAHLARKVVPHVCACVCVCALGGVHFFSGRATVQCVPTQQTTQRVAPAAHPPPLS